MSKKIETPGNMAREVYANIQETVSRPPNSDFQQGWHAAMKVAAIWVEELTSRIEGWELRQEEVEA